MHTLAAPNPWSSFDRDIPRRWRWIAAGLMALAAVTEIVFGVDAEQQSLEEVAEPLSAQGAA